jgi:hypothetical protein
LRGRSAEPEISAILPPMPDNILWHVRGQGLIAGQAPARRIRAPHMKFATGDCITPLISTEAGGEIPPTQPSLQSGDRRLAISASHARCRAENRIYLLTPGERHPASILSGTTSAYGLARGFFTRLSLGDRESNDAPYPDFKEFSTQDYGRRLQDEDDEPHRKSDAADLIHGLLPPATSRLPATPALTSSCFLPKFTLHRRRRPLCRGSRTTATSYQHASAAQALPGQGAVAALHHSPPSPTCGNLRHTRCFCCGIFVFELRNFRMAKARATAKGLHRPVAARWLLKVSTPRSGLKTLGTGYDG